MDPAVETKAITSNILLIIDPQNDFTDASFEGSPYGGTLQVSGATADYDKIVTMLNAQPEFFNEIHVSLDTHTEKHIGHPGFWKLAEGSEIPNSIYKLSIDTNNIITGENIVPPEYSQGTARTITVIPRETELNEYVHKYLHAFKNGNNKHKQHCYIWKKHCIEGSKGHEVYKTLKSELDKISALNADKVTYHIKGQNNLAEMYSIFSAENPLEEADMNNETLKKFIYTGKQTTDGENAKTYDDVKKLKNLNTQLNVPLLQQLLGGPGDKQNTVYICGEAKTHCVKSSVIDLLEYVTDYNAKNEEKYAFEKIILLKDATSPIPGTDNDIEQIVETDYKSKLMDTTSVGTPLSNGGSRKKRRTAKSRSRNNKKSSKNRSSKNKKSRSRKIR